jgi:hypothetical protein
MTEHELEQRLRDWYQARADDAGAVPLDLEARIQAIPDTSPYRPGLFGIQRRMVILAAAAMLLVLLVGGAIAVGAGLIPWLNDDSDTTILAPKAWEAQEETDVDPGTYTLDVPPAGESATSPNVRVTFTLGAGWERVEVTQLLWGNGKTLNFEVVDNLYVDPCHAEQGLHQPPVGTSVDDLANALSAMPAWQPTSPTDIMVDGYPGKRLQLIAPADSSSCTDTELRLFHVIGDSRDSRYLPALRESEHLDVWIVDVRGTRVVIIAGSSPRALPSDLAQLQAVIDSVKFD